jgi:hypothetical protein
MPRLPDIRALMKGPQEGAEEIRSSLQDTLNELGIKFVLPRPPGARSKTNSKLSIPEFIKPFEVPVQPEHTEEQSHIAEAQSPEKGLIQLTFE